MSDEEHRHDERGDVPSRPQVGNGFRVTECVGEVSGANDGENGGQRKCKLPPVSKGGQGEDGHQSAGEITVGSHAREGDGNVRGRDARDEEDHPEMPEGVGYDQDGQGCVDRHFGQPRCEVPLCEKSEDEDAQGELESEDGKCVHWILKF